MSDNSLPNWMMDHPIPEIRNAVQQAQQKKHQYESSKGSLSELNNENIVIPPKNNKVFSDGTVLLIWKEKGNDVVETENEKFPTKSSFYISRFQDYKTKEEMEEIVLAYQKFVSEYNQLPNKSGVYAIVLGKMIKDAKITQKVIESVEIEFE